MSSVLLEGPPASLIWGHSAIQGHFIALCIAHKLTMSGKQVLPLSPSYASRQGFWHVLTLLLMQLVREAVQAEKSAMAARLLQTFQGLKGLMHTRPHDDRSSEASKDIMASLLGPQAAVEAAGLPLASAVSQSQDSGAPIHSYAAFEGDAGPQVLGQSHVELSMVVCACLQSPSTYSELMQPSACIPCSKLTRLEDFEKAWVSMPRAGHSLRSTTALQIRMFSRCTMMMQQQRLSGHPCRAWCLA